MHQPYNTQQMATHYEVGSAQCFYLLKGVLLWHYHQVLAHGGNCWDSIMLSALHRKCHKITCYDLRMNELNWTTRSRVKHVKWSKQSSRMNKCWHYRFNFNHKESLHQYAAINFPSALAVLKFQYWTSDTSSAAPNFWMFIAGLHRWHLTITHNESVIAYHSYCSYIYPQPGVHTVQIVNSQSSMPVTTTVIITSDMHQGF